MPHIASLVILYFVFDTLLFYGTGIILQLYNGTAIKKLDFSLSFVIFKLKTHNFNLSVLMLIIFPSFITIISLYVIEILFEIYFKYIGCSISIGCSSSAMDV
jgi:hypothetical protein